MIIGSKKRKASKSPIDSIEKGQNYDGPSVTDYPIKSEKKKPRDIILSICVLRFPSPPSAVTTVTSTTSITSSLPLPSSPSPTGASSDVRYLFVRRPDTGLLAGQWEFPTVTLYEEGSAGSSRTDTGGEAGMESGNGDSKPIKKSASKKTVKSLIKTEHTESTDTATVTALAHTASHTDDIRVKVTQASSIETCLFSLTELSSSFPAYFRSKLGLNLLDSTTTTTTTSTTDLQPTASTAPTDTDTTGVYTPLLYIRTSPPSICSTSTLKGDISTSQLANNEPIIHIFSHQRHVMHILTYDVLDTNYTLTYYKTTTANVSDTANLASDVAANAKFKLMTYAEAVSIGITSGVKKVLHRVHTSTSATSSSSSTLMQRYNDVDGEADAKATESIGKAKKRGRDNKSTTSTTAVAGTAAATTTKKGRGMAAGSKKAQVKPAITSTDKKQLKQLRLPFLPTTPNNSTSTTTEPSSRTLV